MAHDFSDVNDVDGLSDDELYERVMEELRTHGGIDESNISVEVADGRVSLTGRVGTDAEFRIADHLLTDTLGLADFANELVVDELRRFTLPEEIDETLAIEGEMDPSIGGAGMDHSDTAEHLDEDLEEQTYGTRDVQAAIQDGATYILPDQPTPDGYGSGERH